MTPNKERALAALLTHATKKEAAEAARIDPRTMRRYFEDLDFQRAYRKAFGGMVEDAVRQSQQSLAPALATLREIVEDGEADAQPRISAARSLLEFSIKMTEQLDILDRLTELEAVVGGEQHK